MQTLIGVGPKQAIWWAVAASLLSTLFFAAPTLAQSEKTTMAGASPLAASNAPLDGRQFKAGIVRADADEEAEKRPLGDQLFFRDGKFSSAVCKRYNFAAAPYWVRTEGENVHFLAELTSPTDGTMLWKGTIRGNTLEGTMRWTKKRWYWTINTEHKIRGELEVPRSALPDSN